MTCSNNILFISRPTKNVQGQCAPNCNELGPADCCDKNRLTPRRQREKVREQLKDFVLLMLGAPVVRIELSEQQLDLAVDQAMKVFEDYAPREFFEYFVFNTTPGKSVYEMPPDVGLIRQVFYKEVPTFAFTANDLGGAIPVEYFYPGGAYSSIQGGLIDPIQPLWGNLGSWMSYKQYELMYSRMSSNLGGWEWVSDYRHVKLYPTPCKVQAVIVHYLQRCKDWSCALEGLQEGAYCYSLLMLGRIRGKIKNPTGPGGGVQLDYAELLEEGRTGLEKWRENLLVRYGEVLPIHMG